MSPEVEPPGPPLLRELRGIEDKTQPIASKRGEQLVQKKIRLQTNHVR